MQWYPRAGEQIEEAAARLRHAQRELAPTWTVDRVIDALSRAAALWADKPSPWRRRAADISGAFGLAAVDVSLRALTDSLDPARLRELIAAEGVGRQCGYPLVGHVIAGNTPLLAWVSLIRALLVGSASLVKLPSGQRHESPTFGGNPAGEPACATWARLFHDSLTSVDQGLASTIEMLNWTGGDPDMDHGICRTCDIVLAYGSDRTIASLRALRGGEPFLGYGHRVSIGLILRGADFDAAAAGLAMDILLYDQAGCLSVQAVYVEGGVGDAARFGDYLAAALHAKAASVPTDVAADAGSAVVHARVLARMNGDGRIWEDPGLRWTVIGSSDEAFTPSPARGVVWLRAIDSIRRLPDALQNIAGALQGCAVAPNASPEVEAALSDMGVTYVCAPGRLQEPPLSWRQDGFPVLRSLLAPAAGAYHWPRQGLRVAASVNVHIFEAT